MATSIDINSKVKYEEFKGLLTQWLDNLAKRTFLKIIKTSPEHKA